MRDSKDPPVKHLLRLSEYILAETLVLSYE